MLYTIHAQHNTKRAGSVATFDGFQPPKIRVIRTRQSRRKRDRVLPACRSLRIRVVMQDVVERELRKEKKDLALLKAPTKQSKTTTLQVRLEEEVRHKIDKYAEFIHANPSYDVSEPLKLLFKKHNALKR